MKGQNNGYGQPINIANIFSIIASAGNNVARETLRLPFETATHSRGNAHALFRGTGTRRLARMAAFRRTRCSHLAARRQQTPPFHLLQPAIPSPPGQDARGRTPQCPLAALPRKDLHHSHDPATRRTFPTFPQSPDRFYPDW